MLWLESTVSATEYWANAERSRFAGQHESDILGTREIPDVRKSLELEVEAVGLVMSSLRTRLNSLTSVNRLAPEILAYIFSLLRADDPPLADYENSNNGSSSPSGVLGWIQVTHVCRHWRTVALDHSVLWSDIMFHVLGSEWTKEFFRHSGTAPIVLKVLPLRDRDLYHEYMYRLAIFLEQHLSHTKELCVEEIRQDFMPFIDLLRNPAPLLETLVLHNQVGPEHEGIDDIPSLPPDLSAPRLRHLSLERCRFPWAARSFQSLIHLDIVQNRENGAVHGPLSAPDYAAEIERILDALAGMPSLEVLTLEDVFPPPPRNTTPQSLQVHAVSLVKLRRFYITDDIGNCGLVLKHINSPSSTEYRIHGTDIDWGCDSLTLWLATIFMSRSIRILYIRSNQIAVTNHMSKDAKVFFPEHHDDNTHPFRLILTGPSRRPVPSVSQLQSICQSFPMGGLEAIFALDNDDCSARDWTILFGRYTDVCHVTAQSINGIHLCEQLMAPSEEHTQPLFPSLASLRLLSIDFNRELGFRDRLLEWLQVRNRGAPLKRLIIGESRIDGILVDRLRAVVSELEWDGDEGR
ncbi:hypothetical protein EVG20_g3356 [Dentipellis fragilis]|uniref:F-box domain-containing protein n=1 Tax=Dentipellis fragilis TaxID=205917 RepID=A0A4Y9Z6F3_9AGAM|nr:hypothetical protein EVG20_g3356 [Dentipellis fragilis]